MLTGFSIYTIEKVVLYRQLTKPKVVSLTRPALLKHFKGTANHAGHIWSQQALVPSILVPSLQDWGWISLRGEWRLSCTPLSKITKLRVELVKYARKKGYARRVTIVIGNPKLFFRLQALACMKYQVIRSPRYHLLFFDILYHSRGRLKFSNGLYMMKI